MGTLVIIIIAAYIIGLVFNAVYLYHFVKFEGITFDETSDYVWGVVVVVISFVFWLIVLAAILWKHIRKLWKSRKKK